MKPRMIRLVVVLTALVAAVGAGLSHGVSGQQNPYPPQYQASGAVLPMRDLTPGWTTAIVGDIVTAAVAADGSCVALVTQQPLPGRILLFDRNGARGRRPVVTLYSMNGEYVGMPPSTGKWPEAAERLQRDRWILPSTLTQVRELQMFGAFIANSDMHFGNLSFIPEDEGAMTLAPVYDMLPMRYAPVNNELPQRHYEAPIPEPGKEGTWIRAGERAIEYWQAVAKKSRVSRPFRLVAAENAAKIGTAITRFARSR